MGAKVMVVDDSALSRRMMRRILEGGGHEVAEETNGIAALERYALEKPALVVLDLVMAGMYGLDALIELRRLDPHARVIVASADIQRATRDEAMAAGARGFVSKPFVADDVLRAVDAALAPLAPGGSS
ncbi:MAG: response regulator [Polyangiales bacterium]